MKMSQAELKAYVARQTGCEVEVTDEHERADRLAALLADPVVMDQVRRHGLRDQAMFGGAKHSWRTMDNAWVDAPQNLPSISEALLGNLAALADPASPPTGGDPSLQAIVAQPCPLG
jgi:hypothetical protein